MITSGPGTKKERTHTRTTEGRNDSDKVRRPPPRHRQLEVALEQGNDVATRDTATPGRGAARHATMTMSAMSSRSKTIALTTAMRPIGTNFLRPSSSCDRRYRAQPTMVSAAVTIVSAAQSPSSRGTKNVTTAQMKHVAPASPPPTSDAVEPLDLYLRRPRGNVACRGWHSKPSAAQALRTRKTRRRRRESSRASTPPTPRRGTPCPSSP
mmetsp:Transcript_19972/g.79640  ORF Transcript_19972/g.79640 Transcript_19972/m.79640 type:complete len:210 (+) Transcript_19972:913-1542(+)